MLDAYPYYRLFAPFYLITYSQGGKGRGERTSGDNPGLRIYPTNK